MRATFGTTLGLIVVVGVVSCASPASHDECAVNVPASCPDPSLTYESGVGTTFKSSCSPCHAPGGVESTVPLTDYGQVSKRLTSVAGQLETCAMPPTGSAPLAASARQAIIDSRGNRP